MRYGWSLDVRPWSVLSDILRDSTWKRTYLERDYQSQLPAVAGVYAIFAGTRHLNLGVAFKDAYTAIYVGQAGNLRNRFGDHIRGYGDVTGAKLTFKRLEFWWHPVDVNQLDKFEQALIDSFGPPANRVNVRAKIGVRVPLS